MNTLFKQSNISNKTIVLSLSILVLVVLTILIFIWNITNTHTSVVQEENSIVKEIHTSEVLPVGQTSLGEIDTSDWLTYRNEEYGFEFRYPPIWKFHENKNAVVLKPVDANPTQPIDFGVRIYTSLNEFWDYNGEKTLDEYVTIRSKNGIFKELETSQINNITAKSFKKYSEYLSSYFQNIYSFKDGNIITITYPNDANLNENDAYQKIYNLILQNFVFY